MQPFASTFPLLLIGAAVGLLLPACSEADPPPQETVDIPSGISEEETDTPKLDTELDVNPNAVSIITESIIAAEDSPSDINSSSGIPPPSSPNM